jgi:hypothetical protein
MIDVKEKTCRNITNNFVGSETSWSDKLWLLKGEEWYISFFPQKILIVKMQNIIEKDLYFYKTNNLYIVQRIWGSVCGFYGFLPKYQ